MVAHRTCGTMFQMIFQFEEITVFFRQHVAPLSESGIPLAPTESFSDHLPSRKQLHTVGSANEAERHRRNPRSIPECIRNRADKLDRDASWAYDLAASATSLSHCWKSISSRILRPSANRCSCRWSAMKCMTTLKSCFPRRRRSDTNSRGVMPLPLAHICEFEVLLYETPWSL